MEKETLIRNIKIAMKQEQAELVIKNCQIVNVFTHEIETGDIAIDGGLIIGIGNYEGKTNVDARGKFALPGLIDSHVHVESSFVTPEEFGRAMVPHGTTTTISDPHEIVNVCGMEGLDYMLRASKRTALNIHYMMPSCVPCTKWEHNGAVIMAEDMRQGLKRDGVLGVGEFMDAYGIIGGDGDCLDKILMAAEENAIIDGHSPGLAGDMLAGYMVSGIRTDHECSTIEDMNSRLRSGMYVQLRLGSAATELYTLADNVTEANARRCLLCSDDMHPETILERGDMDESLRVCVAHGINPITAVQMATINAAECYHLDDRGAIAPGRRADIVLVDDLENFKVQKVWIGGELTAEDGKYLKVTEKEDIAPVANSMNVKDFTKEQLDLKLTTPKAHVIKINPGSLLSDDEVIEVELDENGNFKFKPERNIAKISVIERHHATGNIANALIKGYGIKSGAIAVSVGHDSHNIVTVGTTAEDMYFAVNELIAQGGGIILAQGGNVLERLELPVAGLMSTLTVEETAECFDRIRKCAVGQMGVSSEIDPILTLCFMALPVIPELKLTDMGLFNVGKQEFIDVQA